VDGADVVDEQLRDHNQGLDQPALPLDVVVGRSSGDEPLIVAARHRRHQFPGRSRAVKVLYDEEEYAGVPQAPAAVGLTTKGFVAAAGLQLADTGGCCQGRGR